MQLQKTAMRSFKALANELSRFSVLKSRPRQVLVWVLFNLFLCITLWAALAYRAELQRREAHTSLETTARTLVDSYSGQLATAVSTVNEQTLTLKQYLEEGRANIDLQAQWKRGLFGTKSLNGVLITDKDGLLVSSSFPGATGMSMADAQYFIDYRLGRTKGLRIIPPAPGLISKVTIIRFTRDVRDAEGNFNGLIGIGCRPAYFASAFAKSRLGPGGFLLVRDTAGVVYVHQTAKTVDTDTTFVSEPNQLLNRNGFSQMDSNAFVDGVPRYVAWAPVDGTNLTAVAAISLDDALARYNRTKVEYKHLAVLWGLFVLAVCLGGLGLYGRLLIRSLEAERTKRTYRLATERAGEGFYMLQPVQDAQGQITDFTIQDCNDLGAKFMDFESMNLIGKKISDLHPGRYGQQLIALFRRGLEKQYDEAEVRIPAPSRYNVDWINRKIVFTDGNLAVTVQDITEKKRQEKALHDIANTDALTGVPNRHWLNDYLPHALEKARRDNFTVALFFIDLDNFKDINDTLGHGAGDAALRATAERLRTAVRPQDTVVRLGGDEFTVLVEGIEAEATSGLLAKRIVEELARPLVLEGHVVSFVQGSVGVSLFPHDAHDVNELLVHADTAMYAAKFAGKGCYLFFSEEIGRLRTTRLNTERELRQAIAKQEFVVYYQPRVDAKSGRVVGAEALVRWCHPTRGLLLPVEFISIAEQTGLIIELGEIVINLVCSDIVQWSAENKILVPISINVSPIQFNRRDIAALIIDTLVRNSIPSRLIEVELTEAAMLDSPTVEKQFGDLTQHGVKLLVDDFGTGYSSMAQMQQLHLDVLKVDQSLTSKLGRGAPAKVFYQAIVAMGHALNMTITAEGVETLEQVDMLTELSCDEIQGFIVAKPLSPERFQQFLANAGNGNFRDRQTYAEPE